MGLDYKGLAREVNDLIKYFGGPGFKLQRDGTPATPFAPPGPPLEIDIPVSVVTDWDSRLVNGSTIRADDKLAYVPSSIEVKLGDRLIDVTGQTWTILHAKPIQPYRDNVVYELHLRR